MSKYGWERAAITLPSVAVAPLRATLNTYTNTLHAKVVATIHEFWAKSAKQTRSSKLYTERLNIFIDALYKANSASSRSIYNWSPRSAGAYTDEQVSQIKWMLEGAAQKPHKLTLAEISKTFPKAINRTTSWSVGLEAGISLKGRVITWFTGDNNHSVETAHEEPLAGIFFGFLSKVKWTRGTGGVGTGNDEYNEESREAGRGANYITFRYGPLGDREFEFVNGFNPKTHKRTRTRRL